MQVYLKFGPDWTTSLQHDSSVYIMIYEHLVDPQDTYAIYVKSVDAVNGGVPYWSIKKEPIGVPAENNFNEPITINNWFKFAVYYKHSTGSDGRFIVYVNDKAVFLHVGATDDDSSVGSLMFPKLYSYDHASFTVDFDEWVILDTLPTLPYVE